MPAGAGMITGACFAERLEAEIERESGSNVRQRIRCIGSVGPVIVRTPAVGPVEGSRIRPVVRPVIGSDVRPMVESAIGPVVATRSPMSYCRIGTPVGCTDRLVRSCITSAVISDVSSTIIYRPCPL